MYQKDRVYDLTIGDFESGNGVRISQLQLKFDVSKSADNKRRPSSATVEIYNLSASTLSILESEYLECTLAVGYLISGPQVIVKGNVVETKTVKQGTDRVTQFIMGEGYTALNHEKLKGLVAPGKTVEDVIEEIRKQMPGVVRGAYVGTNLKSPILYGYPLNGTPRDMLDDLMEANRLEWRLDNNTLFINEENGLVSKDTTVAPLINQYTGLIDVPFHTSAEGRKLPKDQRRRRGVQFKALLNPAIVPGIIVKIESDEITGFYRINDVRYSGDFRGNDWYIECFCSNVEEEDLK